MEDQHKQLSLGWFVLSSKLGLQNWTKKQEHLSQQTFLLDEASLMMGQLVT
ncbi:hypothetical protein LEMLEM_LOCUS22017 [Lemmus lemmus]